MNELPAFNAATQHEPQWNGEHWIITDKTPDEIPVITVSQLSFRLACGKELWQQIESAVASIPDASAQWEAEQYILKSATVRRDHPLVISLAAALGQTTEQVDAIFTAAKAKDTAL